ncbi:MAG TPA: DNA-formamidopyrimidine glycosylase family protein [Candidatus Eisenbacteria bacterium]|nr:DNA-formamidopyrimidine glycosylase family protein [Candidatus Eisenbacteria bacterium]
MPEGDTVWRAARHLHDALAGRTLTRTDFRVPRLATVDLAGRDVTEVVSRGKHLLARIGDDLTLHSHLRMDGSWHLYRPGQRWRGGPGHQVRAVLANAEWQAVGYRLPVLELLDRAAEDQAVGHLGPDLLGPDWDLDETLRRLTREPGREVGQALLDQRNLAAIGNLYTAEALDLHGTWPWTPVSGVRDLPRLVERARRLLEQNRAEPRQVTTGDPRRGRQHWVFERTRLPCRRCGTPIASGMQGDPPYERITYWCPRCQPEG